jgi:hypothetical protein
LIICHAKQTRSEWKLIFHWTNDNDLRKHQIKWRDLQAYCHSIRQKFFTTISDNRRSFDNLKRVYVDLNKMQTTMNALIRLIQTNKYVEFYVFWNKFQRFIKEMNLSKHFLLIELKRKMFYKLQNVMFIEFNIINDIYELIK